MQGEYRPCCSESVYQHSEQFQPSEFLRIMSPRDKAWDDHRLQAEQVTEIFLLGLPHHQRQADRMRECSQSLKFGWITDPISGQKKLKLAEARFCRVRNCPVCQWRRSLMWVARFYDSFPRIYANHPEMRYILLTLTVKNCRVLDLRRTIQDMNAAWDRMTKRKVWPALGFVRSLEITRSKDGTAHPHFHCLLAVPPSYFGRNYLSTAKWVQLWQSCLRVDYTPICDVRIVKPKDYSKDHGLTVWRHESELERFELGLDSVRNAVLDGTQEMNPYDAVHDAIKPTPVEVLLSAITEVIKYAVKPADMVADPDWLLEMADQLRHSRAVALGGMFRDYLSDDEPKNLVTENSDATKANPGGVFFGWREDPRFAQYKRKKNSEAA